MLGEKRSFDAMNEENTNTVNFNYTDSSNEQKRHCKGVEEWNGQYVNDVNHMSNNNCMPSLMSPRVPSSEVLQKVQPPPTQIQQLPTLSVHHQQMETEASYTRSRVCVRCLAGEPGHIMHILS